jgi:predicted ATPase
MLVGRSAELTQLEGLLRDGRRSNGGSLILLGDPGIGKTALLEATAALATDFVVLRASGIEAESELGFSALGDLLAPVTERLDALPPPQAAALSSALALGPPVRMERFATYSGVLQLLASVAEEKPVLAVVDDVHWLDVGSLEALAFVARRLGKDAIVLLVAARPTEGARLAGGAFPELRVQSLTDAGSRQLLQRAWPQASPTVVDRLLATADGNPLALLEAPGLLSGEQLRGVEPLDDPLSPGASIESAYARRLAALPLTTREALLVAAASDLGEVQTIERALRAHGVDARALEAAERAGLIRIDENKLTFAHPLVRSVVYHAAPSPERRSVHAALAAALAGDRPGIVLRWLGSRT